MEPFAPPLEVPPAAALFEALQAPQARGVLDERAGAQLEGAPAAPRVWAEVGEAGVLPGHIDIVDDHRGPWVK
eukprot:13579979-Alexandrium_andersonii.AAC.1